MWVRTATTSRRQPSSSNTTAKPPSSRLPNRRTVSTRQFSHAGTSRASPMIIHDIGDEHTETDKDICTGTDGRQADQCGPPIPGTSQSQPRPQSTAMETPRTRKAKEQQRRLGVGKPVAAGGPGPRTVTRSTTSSKGKQVKPSRTARPEATIPEEGSQCKARQSTLTNHPCRLVRSISRTHTRCLPLLNRGIWGTEWFKN